MNVLLVDDHGMMREALRGFLSGMGAKLGQDLEFFEVESVPQALALGVVPDLVLLDMQLNVEPSGTEGLAKLRSHMPDTKVIVVSGNEDPELIERCIDLGALGYVPKSYKSDVLIAAITIILQGVVFLPASVLDRKLPAAAPGAARNAAPRSVANHPELIHLTARQRQMLELLMTGKSNKTIAREVGISFGTVKAHLQNLYRALGVENRVKAVCLVSRMGVAFQAPAAAKVA